MKYATLAKICLLAAIACQMVTAKWPKHNSEKAKKRQKDAKDKFQKLKKSGQLDRMMGDNTLRADKHGGKLVIQRKGQYFSMKVKEIVEKHSNETEISKTVLKEIQFNITKDRNDTSQYGVTAAFIEMSGMLPNGANMSVQMFMFKDAGNVTGEDGNIYELVEGGTKTNIKIEGWPNNAVNLDLVIAVKCGFEGKGGKKPKKAMKPRGRKGMAKALGRRDLETFSVCTNAQMTFSPAFNSSENDYDMPAGYPKTRELSGDGEAEIELRFNGTDIFYDPTIESGEDIGDPIDDSSSAMGMRISTFMILGCLAAFLKLV